MPTKRGAPRASPDILHVTFCVESAEGVVLDVRVIPRSKKTAIAGTRENALLVRLAAPPVEGAANDALVDFLAVRLRVPRRAVRLLGGERGRRKRVGVAGVTAEIVRERLLGGR